MALRRYLRENYPGVIEEYERKNTPFYYEPGVLYHPITSGFGCGSGGSKEPFLIEKGNYTKSGDVHMTLVSQWKPSHRCGVTLSEAHKKLKRVDETILPTGKRIPNSKTNLYMTINGVEFTIYQAYWRSYDKNTLGGKVVIRRSDALVSFAYGREYHPYFELYSNFGSTWNLKIVRGWDSVAREHYDTKFKVSVREFKELVFGDPNVKFKCHLFGDV